MNILFLTLLGFDSLKEHNIYTDLLREFARNKHRVFVISPIERRHKVKTHLIEREEVSILRLRIGNTQKTNLIEKGISTILIEPIFKHAIKSFFSNIKFDFILYSTPPITFVSAVGYVKKRDHAKAYLLLKDIFPQNAADIGMLSTTGLKGVLYKHFRKQEKKLYRISDRIGCMSQANVDYLINHNPEVDPSIIEVCPNSIEATDKSVDEETRIAIRTKYNIPLKKRVFVYGGNLGKPQGISFLIECLRTCQNVNNSYFLIVGDGTEYHFIEEFIETEKPQNVKLMQRLPKEDYDTLVGACDVGLIFLDYRFTIPNFPSRLLGYMQAKLPILACTDPNTDIGKVITEGGFGWMCESNDSKKVREQIDSIISSEELHQMGENGYRYLLSNFSASRAFDIIVNSLGV